MLKFVGKRIVQMVLLFLVFLSLVWFLLQAQPGDISQQLITNPAIPPEAQQLLRERLGLDEPLFQQYLTYMGNFLTGDMGYSFEFYPQQVGDILMERLPRTVVLFLGATLLAYAVGFTLGKIIAWKRGRGVETALTVTGIGLYTVFYPWFALMMLWFFGSIVGWFPLGKFITVEVWQGSPYGANQVFMFVVGSIAVALLAVALLTFVAKRISDEPARRRTINIVGRLVILGAFIAYWWGAPMLPYALDILHHLALPTITLALVAFGATMLLTRSSMLETLREDYILTARAKGLPEKTIRDNHAARNALLPVITSLVLALAFVIGGGIITEYVFSWPGMGQTLLSAAQNSDIPLAIGALSMIGVLALVGHLIADILYMYLDPRIRVS